MKCPKCNNEMKMWYSQDGYANAWKCPKCNYTCENQESNNDKERFMSLLDSLGVEYVTGVEEHSFYYKKEHEATIRLRKSDICVCDHYYDPTRIRATEDPDDGLPLNIIYNLIIRFDNDGKFEGFTTYDAE